jgi:hypothetical protein
MSTQSFRLPVTATRLLPAFGLAGFALFSSSNAQAHIKLMEPASWVVEDDMGNPQKTGPCGGDTVTTTGAVTQFDAGQKITVTWQETVGHAGHFRISLAKDRADLIDPVVTTTTGDGTTGNSISAEIMDPVVYPVLVDNLFPRDNVTTAQAEPFTTEVTLPDEPCEGCTLQVVQFMAQHPPGFFYHHCADVNVVAKADAPVTTATGGLQPGAPATSSSSKDSGGCSLVGGVTGEGGSRALFLSVFGLSAIAWRRRARR